MNVRFVMLKNIVVAFLLLLTTACTSVGTKMLSDNGISSQASQTGLGIKGKRAAIVSTGCDGIHEGAGTMAPLMQPVVNRITKLLSAKGYSVVDQTLIGSDDLLVEVNIRCVGSSFNMGIYMLTLGITPAWDSTHITVNITMKSGGGGLLARYRVVGETTLYITALSPIALFMGGNGHDGAQKFENDISRILQSQAL